MNEVLKVVLSLSASGSLLILILLLCKPLLKNRMSRRWQYYIWLIVVARLLLPFTPQVSLVGTAFRQAEQTVVQAAEPGAFPGEHTVSAPELGGLAGGGHASEQEGPSGAPRRQLGAAVLQSLWLVWLGGALLLLIRKITAYQGGLSGMSKPGGWRSPTWNGWTGWPRSGPRWE